MSCQGTPCTPPTPGGVQACRRPPVAVRPAPRISFIPPDVAALWRFLGGQNLGAESVFDF